MKSRSSFTLLPEAALYSLSNRSFMMCVGGQSGTAILSVTSAAEAGARAAPVMTAITAAPAAAANFDCHCMLASSPYVLRLSVKRRPVVLAEQVKLGSIDDDRQDVAGLHADGLCLGQHDAQGCAVYR